MLSKETLKHPLLEELLKICYDHKLEVTKAYTTFEVFTELSEVRKLFDVQYSFNQALKMFYLTGKREKTDAADVYIPLLCYDGITIEEINMIQESICIHQDGFYLIIKDSDSSSTCYSIKRGLTKPDSPSECKRKKNVEEQKHLLDKKIQNKGKILYSKALKNTS